jgi:hypothetical protein
VIYVPYYDPDVVYLVRPGYYSSGSFLSFGVGYAAGFWLGYDLDWGRRRLWVIERAERERAWRDHRDWRPRPVPVEPHYGWQPGPAYVRSPRSDYVRPPENMVRPTSPSRGSIVMPGASRNGPDGSAARPGNPDPRTEPRRFPPSRPPAGVSLPTPAPTYNRGNRNPPADDRGGPNRFAPPPAPVNISPVNSAPAGTRLQPPPNQPHMNSPQQVAPAPAARPERAAPVAPPPAAVQPTAPPVQNDGGRGRRSDGDRQN